ARDGPPVEEVARRGDGVVDLGEADPGVGERLGDRLPGQLGVVDVVTAAGVQALAHPDDRDPWMTHVAPRTSSSADGRAGRAAPCGRGAARLRVTPSSARLGSNERLVESASGAQTVSSTAGRRL